MVHKVNIQSEDLINKKIEQLKDIFPGIFKDGTVDFKLLKDILDEPVSSMEESYTFNWAGKREAIKNIQIRSNATLIPDKENSIKFNDCENIYIEGDNLEVIKLLQSSYTQKVKMIYIDPPYNKGDDVVYKDDFKCNINHYLEVTRQVDVNGKRLNTNPETNGRFHSDWLKMIYPRLFLARNLLRDDGVIFISIDDNEYHNLRMVMNEIFGEENFVANLVWKRRATPPNDRIIGKNHEYILVYAKNQENLKLYLQPRTEELNSRYSNPDNDPRGDWVASDLSANGKGGRLVESCVYPIINPETGEEHYPPQNKCWLYNQEKMEQLLEEGIVGFRKNSGSPFLKRYLSEVRQGMTLPTILEDAGFSFNSAQETRDIFNDDVFEFPKPMDLLKKLIICGSSDNDIILDFFAGSATTAQATLELNQECEIKRNFICVQLPEPIKKDTVAHELGFTNISEIAIERIKRVIKGHGNNNSFNDGFKVFKLDKSNFKIWEELKAEDVTEEDIKNTLSLFQNSLVQGYKDLDVIYEILIKEGFNLNSTILKEETDKYTIYKVKDGNHLIYINLDEKVELDILQFINYNENAILMCLDNALTDETKLNIDLKMQLKVI
ncbi:MAG: site-specific DNA-methyltransferase [bacterium]